MYTPDDEIDDEPVVHRLTGVTEGMQMLQSDITSLKFITGKDRTYADGFARLFAHWHQ